MKFSSNVDVSIEEISVADSPHHIWMRPNISDAVNRAKSVNTDLIVVVGIGGSYSGIKAAVDFLKVDRDKIIFLGDNLDPEHIERTLKLIESRRVVFNIISKSGNTLETVITFGILERYLKDNSVFITTNNRDGYLYNIARERGYEIIEISDNLVGRFSVMEVAAFPLTFLKISMENILSGAMDGLKDVRAEQHALIRFELYQRGVTLDILQIYDRSLLSFTEWWKQLFGESEGKRERGLYPTSLLFTRDLHSLGQYLQEGKRISLQTTLYFNSRRDITLPNFEGRFKFLSHRSLIEFIEVAKDSTIESHDHNPNIEINLDRMSEYNLGFLLFFFQKVAILSSNLLKIDPYTNEGVSLYKSRIEEFYK